MLGETCSHGIPWNTDCPQCDLVSARQLAEHWGPLVDEARRVIAEAKEEGEAQLVSREEFDTATDLMFQAIGAICKYIGPECSRRVREATGDGITVKTGHVEVRT